MCAFYKPSLKDKTLTRAKNWMTFVMAATPDLDLVVLTIESPSVRPLGRAVNGSTRREHLESRHSRRRPHTKGGLLPSPLRLQKLWAGCPDPLQGGRTLNKACEHEAMTSSLSSGGEGARPRPLPRSSRGHVSGSEQRQGGCWGLHSLASTGLSLE